MFSASSTGISSSLGASELPSKQMEASWASKSKGERHREKGANEICISLIHVQKRCCTTMLCTCSYIRCHHKRKARCIAQHARTKPSCPRTKGTGLVSFQNQVQDMTQPPDRNDTVSIPKLRNLFQAQPNQPKPALQHHEALLLHCWQVALCGTRRGGPRPEDALHVSSSGLREREETKGTPQLKTTPLRVPTGSRTKLDKACKSSQRLQEVPYQSSASGQQGQTQNRILLLGWWELLLTMLAESRCLVSLSQNLNEARARAREPVVRSCSDLHVWSFSVCSFGGTQPYINP